VIHAPLSTTSVLDEATDVISLAAPFGAAVILTSMPYRFMQALFLDRLIEIGGEAPSYGRLLGSTANLAIATFVMALWGRAIFARACRLAAARGSAPGREAFRVPPAPLACYIFTGTLAELGFYASAVTCFGPFLALIFGGLAIGTFELNDEVSVVRSLRLIARYGRELAIVIALAFVFLCALVVALVNVMASFAIGLWFSDVFLGVDLTRWSALFEFTNRRFVLAAIAGAAIFIEPLWIAANVVLVRKTGAAETGEDLRVWFEELQQGS
jgi:hypothetical protein